MAPARPQISRVSLQVVVGDDVDFELLRSWIAGDRRAGDRLAKRHYKGVTRFFNNQVGEEDRKQLTQETFLRLCRAAPRFAGRSSFRSFLYGIARNVLNEFLRERYRKPETTFDPLVHSLEEIDKLSISRLISELVRKELLIQCLRELPVEIKQMIELYYWHDLTAAELAELYGIPQATVRTRIHNTRKRLIKMQDERSLDLGSIDIDRQLETLRKLLGYGPNKMDD